MIFAELEYQEDYWDVHEELKNYLLQHFEGVESGLQSDSWFWITIDRVRVSLDTFSSMKHQIKSDKPGPHVQQVLDLLERRFRITIYAPPEPEGHESL